MEINNVHFGNVQNDVFGDQVLPIYVDGGSLHASHIRKNCSEHFWTAGLQYKFYSLRHKTAISFSAGNWQDAIEKAKRMEWIYLWK